jgi:hypothetical protein
MRRIILPVVTALSLGCAGTSPEVVARVGANELTILRLSEILASSPDIRPVPEAVESMAMRWVEYAAFGTAIAAGETLVDSATVVAASWPDVQAAVAGSFRSMRAGGMSEPTPQQVDSVFRAGDVRMLRQILKRTTADMSEAQREAVRSEALRIRDRLMAGGAWEEANAFNDDERGRPLNGSIGMIRRGQTVPAFEGVAFALAPGQLSDVVETDFGFHIIYRPRMAEVTGEFTLGVNDIWIRRLDSAYVAELTERRPITLATGSVERVRGVIEGTLYPTAEQRQPVLATYSGGEFTVGDLVRYLRFLTPQFFLQAPAAPDDQIAGLLRSFVIRDITNLEAIEAGAALSPVAFERIRDAHTQLVERVESISGISPDVFEGVPEGREREELVATRVDEFLEQAARDNRFRATLPPGLSSYLLERIDWELVQPGIDEVVARAAILQSMEPSS